MIHQNNLGIFFLRGDDDIASSWLESEGLSNSPPLREKEKKQGCFTTKGIPA